MRCLHSSGSTAIVRGYRCEQRTKEKWVCAQRRLSSVCIRPVWSQSSLCAQSVAKDPRFLHANSEDSDQTGRMPRLIWVFAGRKAILLVLSCRGSDAVKLLTILFRIWATPPRLMRQAVIRYQEEADYRRKNKSASNLKCSPNWKIIQPAVIFTEIMVAFWWFEARGPT